MKVRLVAHPHGVRNGKVVHEGGELDGMDEWVNPTALIVPWSQWSNRLAAEKREAELRLQLAVDRAVEDVAPGTNSPSDTRYAPEPVAGSMS